MFLVKKTVSLGGRLAEGATGNGKGCWLDLEVMGQEEVGRSFPLVCQGQS